VRLSPEAMDRSIGDVMIDETWPAFARSTGLEVWASSAQNTSIR
jgi:hypothetical protein